MSRRVLTIVSIVVLLLGFMVGIQFRVSQGRAALGPENLGSMASLLLAAEKKNSQLEAYIQELRLQLASKLKGQAELKTLVQELHQANVAAGLTAVSGPGVIVTLTQPPQVANGGSLFTIHDTDLLIVVNELRSAGAQAISINGQRLVATTEIRQAGSIFSINNTVAAAPFTITAVGPPQTMQEALQISGGIADTLMAVGIGVKIQTESKVTVPAYQGSDLP